MFGRNGWVVESNRLLIYRTIFCTQGSNPCFSSVSINELKKLTFFGNLINLCHNKTFYWDCSSIWLEHRPVTAEVASSSLVSPVLKQTYKRFESLYRKQIRKMVDNLIIICWYYIIIKKSITLLVLLIGQTLMKDQIRSSKNRQPL